MPLKLTWESVVHAVAWVFKNHRKDQLATRIEFEGSVNNPDINVWYLPGQVLRNAFIQAYMPLLKTRSISKMLLTKSRTRNAQRNMKRV